MTKKEIVNPENPNGIVVDMTPEEETQHTTDIANDTAKLEADATAKTEKENAQASGNQKLLDLGLTQAEATALTGYTPPEEDEE